MHTKKEILDYIRTVASQQLSKEELLEAFEAGKQLTSSKINTSSTTPPISFSFNEILYYLGGIIILSGIVVLLIQYWHDK